MLVLPTNEELREDGRSLREWAEDMDESIGYVTPQKDLVEQAWIHEVLPAVLVEDENGKPHISIERLKGEIYELLWARNTAQTVYNYVTGGLTANLTVSSEGIIAMAERKIEDRIEAAVNFALNQRDGV